MSQNNMTVVVVILIGAGTIFVASALDNSSIVDTFQKIISGQPIDWSGTSGPITTQKLTGGTCPSGWDSLGVTNASGKSQNICSPPVGSKITTCPAGGTPSMDGSQFVCLF
jgi:hypothetical protein